MRVYEILWINTSERVSMKISRCLWEFVCVYGYLWVSG